MSNFLKQHKTIAFCLLTLASLFIGTAEAATTLSFFDTGIATAVDNVASDLKAIGGVIALVAATAWGYKAIRKAM